MSVSSLPTWAMRHPVDREKDPDHGYREVTKIHQIKEHLKSTIFAEVQASLMVFLVAVRPSNAE